MVAIHPADSPRKIDSGTTKGKPTKLLPRLPNQQLSPSRLIPAFLDFAPELDTFTHLRQRIRHPLFSRF
jgi:hypothetical protein